MHKTYSELQQEMLQMPHNGKLTTLEKYAYLLKKDSKTDVVAHTAQRNYETGVYTERFFCHKCNSQITLTHTHPLQSNINNFKCPICGNTHIVQRPDTDIGKLRIIVEKTDNGFMALQYCTQVFFPHDETKRWLDTEWYASTPVCRIVPIELYLYDKDAGFTYMYLNRGERELYPDREPATIDRAADKASWVASWVEPTMVSLAYNWTEMKAGLNEWAEQNKNNKRAKS